MKFKLLVTAMIVLVMAGCHFQDRAVRVNDGGLVFKDALADFAQVTASTPGRGQAGRNLYPSDPAVNSSLQADSALIRETLPDGCLLYTSDAADE